MSRRFAVLIVAFLAVACGANTSPLPAPKATDTASPSQTVGPGQFHAGAGQLPAGIQFLGPGVILPLGFSGAAVEFAGKSFYFGSASGSLAMTTTAGSSWTTTSIDDGHGYSPPTGLKFLMTPGFLPGPTAVTKTGIVLVGDAAFSDIGPTTETHTTRESALWFSPDALQWTMTDPRSLLGGVGKSVTISDVSADKNGFVAVGSVAASTNTDKPQIVVLRSSDGLNWSLASEFGSTWSVESGSLAQFQGDLLLSGWEYACTTDAGTHNSFSVGAQLRMWRSADGGATWTAIDLAGAEPVIHVPNAAPANAAACPKASDLQTIEAKYTSTGFLLGVFDNHVVAISQDKTTISVTSDLKTWQTAVLPDRQPTGKTSNGSLTQLLTSESGGWIYRSFEPLRDSGGQQQKVGYQVRWWRSTDSGATWTEGTPGKPMEAGGAFVTLVPHSDGSVEMVTAPTSASGLTARTVVSSSVAGPAVDWMNCVAAPNADCSFASVVTVKPGTTDLRGVNLAAARMTGVSLPGADLTTARLYTTTLDGNFADANFSKNIINNASLSGTFDGADFSGADLSGATLAGSMSKANFSGAYFAGATVAAKLNGASFKGAHLDGAFFSGADLTGADMSGVTGLNVTFDKATVTCPDGQPSNPSATGLAACRIKP
jgi:hypothetical protein